MPEVRQSPKSKSVYCSITMVYCWILRRIKLHHLIITLLWCSHLRIQLTFLFPPLWPREIILNIYQMYNSVWKMLCHSCQNYELIKLFRRSLDFGVVPEDWKCVNNITPIFKKGHQNKAENYRPVSLTSEVCKIFETIIRNSVVKYLETNMLILNSQHGFRKGHSCLSNLLVLLNKVTGSISSGEAVDVIFMDFAKAFDKVPHIRLGRKLAFSPLIF